MPSHGPPARRNAESAVLRGLRAAQGATRWLMAIFVIVFFASGITFVQPGEVALVLRLGRLHGETPADQVHPPGLLFAWPYPIDEVLRVPVKREGELILEDVWRSLEGVAESDTINPLNEGYVLTGNQNVIQAKLVVKYRIDDPVDFRLRMNEPDRVLRNVTLSSLSRIVSGWKVDDVLRLQAGATADPAEGQVVGDSQSLATLVTETANQHLSALSSGVRISSLEFREIHPSRHVVGEFRLVQSARIATETLRREAEGFAARQIPAAEAERNRLKQAAAAEASGRTARARAEVAEYLPTVAEYRRFPDLVRQRLSQETFESVMERVGQVKVVPPGTRPLIADPEQRP